MKEALGQMLEADEGFRGEKLMKTRLKPVRVRARQHKHISKVTRGGLLDGSLKLCFLQKCTDEFWLRSSIKAMLMTSSYLLDLL